MRLRPYCRKDAETILSWIDNEYVFRQWSADRYDHYPITAADMNAFYDQFTAVDWFYPLMAFDDDGIAGHLIMRFTEDAKETLRFGFIIINPKLRSQGKGKEMLLLAKKVAFEVLGAKMITIGVFENNPAAYHCYLAAGFRESRTDEPEMILIDGEPWKCIQLICEEI